MGMDFDLKDEIIYKIYDAIDEYELKSIKLIKEDLLLYINNNCNLNLNIDFIHNLINEFGTLIYEDKDLVDTITYLSKKYDLYAISNWFTDSQIKRLEKMGIAKYFKKVIGADINYYKPYEKTFDIILKNYNASECLSVGDSLQNDIILPKSLGMNVIWKTNESSLEYVTIKCIKELKNIL